MSSTTARRLPSAPEVVRTLLHGVGAACVSGPLGDHQAVAALHGCLPDGTLVLAVPTDPRAQAVLATPAPGSPADGDDWPVSLCVRADAALADLTVPRAHLEVLGWARRVRPTQCAQATACLRQAWPVDDTTLTQRYELLLVEVAEAELHWMGGCVTVQGEEIRSAEPDPLWTVEAALLERLQQEHSERLLDLVRTLGDLPVAPGMIVSLDRATAARPVAVDRYGITLQCLDQQDVRHLLRWPFSRPLLAQDDPWDTIVGELVTYSSCAGLCRDPG